ncbi:hypothetical protein CLV78_106114 [Aliiruegeria haliotis]|uniref:Uncharacterized protein n=2 Tax=Aliiruegeria haliotis TaxID=1280846 RepID=A0A2T0RN09_9RHOB|nr:hypothetical protein CLV78_106114 [Aliiruegeria haliotis]
MTFPARFLSVCLLAAFLLGTVYQVAAAGMMVTMDMPGAAHAQMETMSCADCDHDTRDGASECGGACVSVQMASLPVDLCVPSIRRTGKVALPEARFRTRVDLPAETPPRSLS